MNGSLQLDVQRSAGLGLLRAYVNTREAMVETHEERLVSDPEYAEEWRLSRGRIRLRDEEDFHYAMIEAVEEPKDRRSLAAAQ